MATVTPKKLGQVQIPTSSSQVSNLPTSSGMCAGLISLSSTKAIALSDDNGQAVFARFQTIGADGTVTQGNKYTVYNGVANSVMGIALTSTKFLIAYSDDFGNAYAAVGDESSGVLTFGSPELIMSTTSGDILVRCAKITDSTAIFACQGTGAYKVVAASISGTALTFGTEVIYSLVETYSINLGVLSSSRAIITYGNGKNPVQVSTANIINISSLTLTLQHRLCDSTAYSNGCNVVRLDDDNIFVAYQDSSTLTYVYGVVGQISNGNITWGSPTTLCTAATPQSGYWGFDICALSSTLVFLAYTDSATVVKNVTCSISGTSITPNTGGAASQTVSSLAAKYINCKTLSSTLVAVSYADTATSYKLYCCSISGTTPTAGSLTGGQASISGYPVFIDRLSDTSFVFINTYASNTLVTACTVSGTTITAGSGVKAAAWQSRLYTYNVVAIDSTHGIVICKRDSSSTVPIAVPFTVSGTTVSMGATQNLDLATVDAAYFIKAILLDSTHIAVMSLCSSGDTEYYMRLYSLDGYVLYLVNKEVIDGRDFNYNTIASCTRSFINLSSIYLCTFSGLTMRAKLFKWSTTKVYSHSSKHITNNGAISTPIAVLDSSNAIVAGYNGNNYPTCFCIAIKSYVPCCGANNFLNVTNNSNSGSIVVPLTATTAIQFFVTSTSSPYKIGASVLTIDSYMNISQGDTFIVNSNTIGALYYMGAVALSATRAAVIYSVSASSTIITVVDISGTDIYISNATTIVTGVTDGHSEISSIYLANESDYDAIVRLYAHGSGASPGNLLDIISISARSTSLIELPNSPIILDDSETLRATSSSISGYVTATAYGLEEV